MAAIADLIAVGINPRWAKAIGADWQEWTPTWSASGSMTFTSIYLTMARYIQIGKLVVGYLDAFGAIGGTPSHTIEFTIPVTAYDGSGSPPVGGGYIDAAPNVAAFAFLNGNTTQIGLRRYDGANISAGGARAASCFFCYEAA